GLLLFGSFGGGLGCGKHPEDVDMGADQDLRGVTQDLAPPEDLNGAAVAVTGLPQTCPPGVNAAALYTVASMRCGTGAGSGCHGADMPTLVGFTSADEMTRRLVNNTSVQVPLMVRAKPGNIDQSYMMYKIMGQQKKPGGSGDRMPSGRVMLPVTEICM